jgi:tetrahydromethanopterin S-methyltransferase subunit G
VVVRLAESKAGVEEVLVKLYSKHFKMSEDEARAMLQPILAKKDVLKTISSRLPEIQATAEAISKLPPELRQPMVDFVTRGILSHEDEEDMSEISKMAKSISKAAIVAKMVSQIMSEAFKEGQGEKKNPQEVEALKAELDKIREEVKAEIEKVKQEIKGARRKSILVKLAKSLSKLAEVLEAHEKRFEEIEKKIESIESIQQTPVTQQAQPQTESKEGESKEDLRKKVRELIRESTEFLEEFGYEVKKPGESTAPKEKRPIDKFIDRIAEALSDKDVIRTMAETIKETLKELRQAQGQGQSVTATSIPRLESYLGEAVGGGEGSEGSGVAEGSASSGS